MEFTCELSKAYSITPFEIMKHDKDIVIMLINYYIEKGNENEQPNAVVNDKLQDKMFWGML